MMPAGVPGPGAGAATRASGGAADAARVGGGDDSGFADLLTGPAPAAEARPARASGGPAAKAQDEAPADPGDQAAADPPVNPMLPGQLLALITAWPAAATATSATAAVTAAPSASMPGTGSPAPGPLAPPSATISALALAGGTTAANPALASVPTAGAQAGGTHADARAAMAATAVATPATAVDNADAAGAIPLADLAKVLGLAATTDAAATPTGESTATLEVGDRDSLLAPTASTVATPARAAAVVAANPVLTVPADPDAGFDDAFGARIGWLADQRIGRADIRLNPEHLGAIDVRLQIDGTRVSAEFQSAHADVRHALENSVGRLREMLGQQGLQLAQSDVGQGRNGEHGDRPASARGGDGSSEHDSGLVERPLPPSLQSRGLLDEYA